MKGILLTTLDPYSADYTVTISYNCDPATKVGSVSYSILDKKGNLEFFSKCGIVNTTSVRLNLLSIWSALRRIKKNNIVRVVTDDAFFINSICAKRLDAGANKDLKKNMYKEMNRVGEVFISMPLTATDRSILDECKQLTASKDKKYETILKQIK
jgi:ribonuclease HI